MAASSNSPNLLEVINLAIDRFMSDVHTSMPGKIVSYDVATQTATVQPSLKRTYVGGEPQLLPQLQKVPVIFPSIKNGWLRFPVSAGDTVLLLFSERSLDTWFKNGGEVDPMVPHKFNMSDAVAVIGLNPSTVPIVPKGASSSTELAFGSAYIEITALGQFRIKNTFADLMSALKTFATTSSTATTAPQIAAAAATLLTALTFLAAP